MKLLATTSYSLLLLDAETGAVERLHHGAGLYYGIAASPTFYYVAARHRLVSSGAPPEEENGEILVFNRRFQLIARWQAPFPLRDVHEIRYRQGQLWVTCSFDNLVAIRRPDGSWQRWHPLGEPQGESRDRNHFNSLYFEGPRVWVLAHNRGPSELLAFDIASRARLDTVPLGRQAHNIWRQGGELRTCSSAEGRLVGHQGFAVETGGFPRGIARLEDGYAVGISEIAERRERDLSTGQVAFYDAAWRERGRVRLPGEGLVLDLHPVR